MTKARSHPCPACGMARLDKKGRLSDSFERGTPDWAPDLPDGVFIRHLEQCVDPVADLIGAR
ncbi:MAG: hypothetical protein WEB93_06715, partial [Sphingomonadales bacterium]